MRTLNIPEGTSDFDRLRSIYQSLVDECKQADAVSASLRKQLDDAIRQIEALKLELASKKT